MLEGDGTGPSFLVNLPTTYTFSVRSENPFLKRHGQAQTDTWTVRWEPLKAARWVFFPGNAGFPLMGENYAMQYRWAFGRLMPRLSSFDTEYNI